MWEITEHEREVFPRNGLRQVICQARFEPVELGAECVDAFSSAVRDAFPEARRIARQNLQLDLAVSPPAVKASDDHAYRFESPDERATLQLAADSLSLTEVDHKSHAETALLLSDGLGALRTCLGLSSTTRLGLRYVNVLNLEDIRRVVARDITWQEVVRGQFLQIPRMSGTSVDGRFFVEATDAIRGGGDQGFMTVRFGFPGPPSSPRQFVFDVDRYVEKDVTVEQLPVTVESFAKDIYDMFREVTGDGWIEWMRRPSEERE